MPTIEHFEIPADNVERAKKFYEEMFGWKITKTPMPVEYWIIETKDDAGKPALRGGMSKRQNAGHIPCNYVSVDDADAYAKKCVELGGKVLHQIVEPHVGKMVMMHDSEGNMIAVWQKATDFKG